MIGVLLVNLGTPSAPTTTAVRRYLGEFLADPRIVDMPRWLWRLILHGIILRTRPRRSAQKYQAIWTEKGSPLLVISQAQVHKLQHIVTERIKTPVKIVLGLRYGEPSIAAGLEQLREADQLVILPLYPQYSATTTGSTFDAVSQVLQQWRRIPTLRFIADYHEFPDYIQALTTHIQADWTKRAPPEKLLFSFHGLPQRFAAMGDPYPEQCYATAQQIAQQLKLPETQWQVVFQSRFGREAWLQPYTDHTLIALAQAGIKRVDVVCPGFAADCLETLEEINQENRGLFLQAGGQAFHYISALNDGDLHIEALFSLIKTHLKIN